MKNILLLGTDTMLGHIIYLYFKNQAKYSIEDYYQNVNFSANGNKLLLSSLNIIKEMISNLDNTIIINTLSVSIKESKENFDKAVYINSFFPNFISSIVKNTNNKFIHISTDCVFSGKLGDYSEYTITDSTDSYGSTKSYGEVHNGNDLTIRTSKIGPCLINQSEELFDWFIRQEGSVKGYKNALWNGVTTLELAKMIEKAIEKDLTGVYNIAPFSKISKYDLLSIINDVFNKSLIIEPTYDVIIDRSLKDTRNEIISDNRNYYEMFVELNNFILSHQEHYCHYII